MDQQLTLVGGMGLVVASLSAVVRYLYLGQERRHNERVAELQKLYSDLRAERDRDIADLKAENRRLTSIVLSLVQSGKLLAEERAEAAKFAARDVLDIGRDDAERMLRGGG